MSNGAEQWVPATQTIMHHRLAQELACKWHLTLTSCWTRQDRDDGQSQDHRRSASHSAETGGCKLHQLRTDFASNTALPYCLLVI
jgi:hypothetical protein